MMKARLLTIGTEITAGEVINSNAAWISERLEDAGVRVYSHLTVRDQSNEILHALNFSSADASEILIVTGGLGPTSDDMTRACLAAFAKVELDFDEAVWNELKVAHAARNIPLREAHRHQCFFPRGSERLANPVGTALGFAMRIGQREVITLPGPPRELAAMWSAEVAPRLRRLVPLTAKRWVRWTCLGVPESEVAELVEPIIAGRDVEVGYRAQVPYIKVKVFVDPAAEREVVDGISRALEPAVVATGTTDLAEELLERWPHPSLRVVDRVSRLGLITRLLAAQRARLERGITTPEIVFSATEEPPEMSDGFILNYAGEELQTELHRAKRVTTDRRRLPFKLKLDSERGRRAAAEWAIWHGVKTLRAERT